MERQTLDSYFHRLVHGPPFKPGEEMKYEMIRNASFQGWPSSVQARPPQLAKEGFYYTGHSDEVHCFRCGIIIKDWESGFVPSDKHRQYSPQCPVVLGMDKENVPLAEPGHLAAQSLPHIPAVPPRAMVKEVRDTKEDSARQRHQSFPMTRPTRSHENIVSSPRERVLDAAEVSMQRRTSANAVPMVPDEVEEELPDGLSEPQSELSERQSPSSTSARSSRAMIHEAARLATFSNWPGPHVITPAELAKAGFYYSGHGDQVNCAFCHNKLQKWVAGDTAMGQHRQHFRHCPFVQGLDVGNVPSDNSASVANRSHSPREASPVSAPPPGRSSFQVVAPSGGAPSPGHIRYPVQVPPGGSDGSTTVSRHSPTVMDPGRLGIQTSRPKHPIFSNQQTRLDTFKAWPKPDTNPPATLSEAGLFYMGQSDNVRCFFCDGGLRNWTAEDDPWEEHARWFPRCDYLKDARGEDFIQRIQQQTSPQLLSSMAQAIPRKEKKKALPGGVRLRVDPAVLRDCMESRMTRQVLEMGYSRELVERVIQQQLREKGTEFANVQLLVEAILKVPEPAPAQASVHAAAQAPSQHASVQVQGSVTAPSHITQQQQQQQQQQQASTAKQKKKKRKKKKKNGSSSRGSDDGQQQQQHSPRRGGAGGQSASLIAAIPSLSARYSSGEDDEGEDDEEEDEEQPQPQQQPEGGASGGASDDTRQLRQDVERMQEERTCKVCMELEACVVFLPCGHLVCCADCATRLTNCPICRSLVRGTIRAYLS